MFKRVDIIQELVKEKNQTAVKSILDEVHGILEEQYQVEQDIMYSLSEKSEFSYQLHHSCLNPESIFTIEQIRSVCIRYRMRFLDAELFKGEIPFEAIGKIKSIQKSQETQIKKFKILAPKRLFKLNDADADPLLFVPLTNGNYYLIHKWGTDMKWFRKVMSFPFQCFENLILTLLVLTLLIALLIPNEILVPESNMAVNNVFSYWGFHRVAFFFHFLILAGGITTFIWFSFHQNFSEKEWNSTTFN